MKLLAGLLLASALGTGWCEIIDNGGLPPASPRQGRGGEPTPPPPDDPTPPPSEPVPTPAPGATCDVIHCADGFVCVAGPSGIGQCVLGSKR